MQKRDPILRSFGQSVVKHRRTKELSQEALAEKADIDRTYLSDIEQECNSHCQGFGHYSLRSFEGGWAMSKLEEKPTPTEARPFIKWAGGKRWLSAHISKIKPKGWNSRYFEPFVGGGAFFFALQPKRATLSDANKELMATYLAIRNNPDDVIQLLQSYPFGERFFYRLRDQNPRAGHTIAARFLYLNRTCWIGLYRVTIRRSGAMRTRRYVTKNVFEPHRNF